jgi:hypothetical protein
MQRGQSAGDQIRALRLSFENELSVLGTERQRLLRQLAVTESKIRVLAVDAADAGVTYQRIGDLVGLTSGGVSKWISKTRSK